MRNLLALYREGETVMSNTVMKICLGTLFSWGVMGATGPAAADLTGWGDSTKVYNLARCSGNNFARLGGTELNTTNLQLQNFDSVNPITITRLIIYDAQGVNIYDSKILGLPEFNNGILGPMKDTLRPHQSSIEGLDGFLPLQEQMTRPLQILVESSSVASALPLQVRTTLVVRERNPNAMPPSILVERSRTVERCESIRRLRPLD